MLKPRARARRLLGTLLAAISVLAVVLALAAPAQAAPRSSSPTTVPAAKPAPAQGKSTAGAGSTTSNVRRSCPRSRTAGKMACLSLVRTDIAGQKGLLQPHVTPDGYGPADLQDAYDLPSDAAGGGQTVAIVDAHDNPNAEADLTVYRAQYGLPACTTDNGCFRKIDQRGGTDYPTPDAGWAGEIALDLDMVSASCPKCHILLVEADDAYTDNLGAAVNKAVDLGAKYVSNSYGGPESPDELDADTQYFKHPGVAVTVSSGDDGYGVEYPAASQYVTSVGGTSLSRDDGDRGWTESVWNNSYGAPGSGCSDYEAKPSWQTDDGCDNRTVADVSAVADPETGVAVYNTYEDAGWGVYGGTSASSPIIAGAYALAGAPGSSDIPSSYAYASKDQFNDVTDGDDGVCDPDYLCTARTGYDGPTGLGTPDGVLGLATPGPHGTIAGKVTDSSTHKAIADATVTAGDATTTTGDDGTYSLSVPVGSYTVTASAYGYTTSSASAVVVRNNRTTTQNFALAAAARVSVSGRVTDGSGHNWPLYASITIDGVPGGPFFTDPVTGRYALRLPVGSTYTMHVQAKYPGYDVGTATVDVGSSDTTKNIRLTVDATSCTAPGYGINTSGSTETFDGTSTPAGWTVTGDRSQGVWEFDDPKPRGNLTGGTGNFAIVDSDYDGVGAEQDTSLISPVHDLSQDSSPAVTFHNDYYAFGDSVADVDLSVDGGKGWQTIWEHTDDSQRGPMLVTLPIPQAAGKATVQVRFHYTGSFAYWWEVDDVFIGNRACDPVHGGLVTGFVRDGNTGQPVNGATVRSVQRPTELGMTRATPADPNIPDGIYWLFSSVTGRTPFTASARGYGDARRAVTVATDSTTKANFTLQAGQITVSPSSIDKTLAYGTSTTAQLTIGNTGAAPATVTVSESGGGFQILNRQGAPLQRVKGRYSNHALTATPRAATVRPRAASTPADAPWSTVADLPVALQDNGGAAGDGKVYSVGGFDGTEDTAAAYAYDPATNAWSTLASMSDTRERPSVAYVGGRLYAVNGWGPSAPDASMEIYDPGSDSWSAGPDAPEGLAAQGVAVLGSTIYMVGGCPTAQSCGSSSVYSFDTTSSTWTKLADYPHTVSWEGCGALSGAIYCAGGSDDSATYTDGYVYDPASDSWSAIADLPADLWGGGYTAADGQLLLSGGVTNDSSEITNEGWAYDPQTDAWTALPNSNTALYRGGSACGFYKFGGNAGGSFTPPDAAAEQLPGYDQCGASTDVPWLSEAPTTVTVAPGATATITVTLDAGVPQVNQPGTYTAQLLLGTDTPYSVDPVGVTMHVTPPATWGKVTGTVLGWACDGTTAPLAGATVQLSGYGAEYTLKTDADGHYAYWLDRRASPLTVIAAKDGYAPQSTTVRVLAGQTVTQNFTLKVARTC